MAQKVVLVTGCSEGGLGHAVCREFAAAGCKVYASARPKCSMRLSRYGCIELELDVTQQQQIDSVVERIILETGHIDIVVNNAGAIVKAWTIECPMDAVRKLMEVNFFAVLAINNAVAPHMIQRGCGTIVNIGSSTSYAAVPMATAYTASKFAIRAYSDALRVELAPFNVKVMHVAPGFMKTRLFAQQGAIIPAKPDSHYNKFTFATKELYCNNTEEGIGSWGATQPHVIAARLVKHALKRNPPRHYVDGWTSWPIYYVGCYSPCWLQDLLHAIRLQLFPAGSLFEVLLNKLSMRSHVD